MKESKRRGHVISIRLSEAEYRRLQQVTEEEGDRSMSEFTRSLLSKALRPESSAPVDPKDTLAQLIHQMTQLVEEFKRACESGRRTDAPTAESSVQPAVRSAP